VEREEGNGVLVTNHVLSGALIGATVRRPVLAFALGVASHFALDAAPHWGDWDDYDDFLRIAVPDGLVGLTAMAAVTALTPPERRCAVLAGMAGAAMPDLDKPAKLWFGRSPWPAAVNRFHHAIQNEARHRFGSEMLTMGAFAVATVIATRRGTVSRGAAGTRGRPGRRYHRW
jgi:hypothetical protein